MPASGHNEADTRAKLIDPALHQACWVEGVLDAVRCCSLGQITNALFEVGGQYRRSM
jgi:methylmalonyl-CoA mutase